MANRFPLIVNSGSNQIQELAAGDGLDLTGSQLVNATFSSAKEKVVVSPTAATGTIAFDTNVQSVLYYTSNASANWTLNVRGDSSTTLNNFMSIGESLSIAFMVTTGATPYYQTGFQIDGVSVTPKWQEGAAPSSGNANSIEVYSITIIKTASATYTALASRTKFA